MSIGPAEFTAVLPAPRAMPQASNRAVVEMHLANLSRCSQPATAPPVEAEVDAGGVEASVVDAGVPSLEPVAATKPVDLQLRSSGPAPRSVVGVSLAIAGGTAVLTGGAIALRAGSSGGGG